MIRLSGELKPEAARSAWLRFAPLHYDFGTIRQSLADNSKRYLALDESGRVVGFAAASSLWGKGDSAGKPRYRSHKIVVKAEYQHLWSEVADALAHLYVSNGYSYSCIAPDSLTSYRLNNPNWEKRDNSNLPVGCSSWKYIGAATFTPFPVDCQARLC